MWISIMTKHFEPERIACAQASSQMTRPHPGEQGSLACINRGFLTLASCSEGRSFRALHERFRRTITIELAPTLAAQARHEFRRAAGVEVITGDSGMELNKILATLDAPTVFWLDAHYSGPRTMGENVVPILAEINSIWSKLTVPHAIIIDDLREFVGDHGYPTRVKLLEYLGSRGYETNVSNDMLQAIMICCKR
jgi:hypothetical protein